MTTALEIISGAAACAVGSLWAERHPEFALWWYAALSLLCCVASASAFVVRDWPVSAFTAFGAALSAWDWWRHWRKRKRRGALARAGAKSRARVAALVRKTRETARPRPVRQPLPERSS